MANSTTLRHLLTLSLLICGGACTATAQDAGSGAISGTVYDPAHRVIHSAEVVAVNHETHISRRVSTSADGDFHITLLLPGVYDVSVRHEGFTENLSKAIEVTVGRTASLDVTLTINGGTETVQVDDASSMADRESSVIGSLTDGTAINELPLSTRNFTQILGLGPGVIADIPTPSMLGNGTQNVASNGATPTSNNIQFNGIDANNLVENSAANSQNFQAGTAIPAPDTIEEFRVQTANFDAAYGRGSGANVNLITRSGTNRFHGNAWEFVRNNLFNANDFFTKGSGQPRQELKQNIFGATFGGPIHKDQSFFFVSYQGIRQVSGLGDLKTTDLPMLTSDRSAATLGAQFCPANHPGGGYSTSVGGTQVACDGSNINPVALAFLNAKFPNGQFVIPNPQIALPPSAGQLPLGRSTFAVPGTFYENQFTVNLDHKLTAKNSLAARFFYARSTLDNGFTTGGDNLPGWGTDSFSRNTMFVLADTHVFNSRLVNVARFGFMRFDGNSSVGNPIPAQASGIGTPTGQASAVTEMPALTVGSFTMGDGGTPSQWEVTNSFIYQDTVAYKIGSNNLRFGVEYKRHEIGEIQEQQASGNVMVGALPDFLIGLSQAENGGSGSNIGGSIAGGGNFRRDERYNNFATFAQDDWKLSSRLTLNLGLRYEIFGAPTELHGRLSNFIPGLAVQGPVPAAGTLKGYNVSSDFQGPVPADVTVNNFPGFYRTPYGDIQPRVGFAWQMTDKPMLVLRGGYGMYYDEHSGNLAEQTLSQIPFSSIQFAFGGQNTGASLQHPFVPLVPPTSSYPIFQPITQGGSPFIEATNPNIKDGRTDEYNLNLQYAFRNNYVAQVGYVGTRSVHRPGQVEFDQAPLASPSNPIFGITTNTKDNAANRFPVQGISPGSLETDSVFTGNYNSLQASITRRMAHGLQFQGSYTWSKNLDEVNGEAGTTGVNEIDLFELQLPTNNQFDLRHSSYGLANDDRAQRLVVSLIWAAPKLHNGPAFARYLLNNWELSGIGVIQSGAAFSVFDNNAGSVYGLLGGETRAQLAPGKVNPLSTGSLFSRVTGSKGYLNQFAFTNAPEAPNGQSLADQDFGNSGVGIVRGPGQHNLDLAVERIFPIAEGKSFLFRAEAFNLTNTPQFGPPNTTLGYGDPTLPPMASGTFGQILAEEGGPHPRIIQLAAKFQF